MKKILTPTFNLRYLDGILLFLRIAIGCFMLSHGIPKIKNLFSENISFPDPIGIGVLPSLILTVFAEVICSVFILIGLITRMVVIPLIIVMLVAVFIIHFNDGFGKQEMALHYLVVYILLFITGSGKYSVDQLIFLK